ncbi:hypothetical protein DFH06DRAFT_1145857 [Mycena polygramma]|nr:hypothetical protein DFH06DRAFT_1145857 [Mycena polygramma]
MLLVPGADFGVWITIVLPLALSDYACAGLICYTFLVLYWKYSIRPLRRTLPSDLWAVILEEYCHLDGHTFSMYNHSRDELCGINLEIAAFIKSDSRFWTKITVVCDTTLPEIQRHIRSLVPGRPVDVSIFFDVDQTWVPNVGNVGVRSRPMQDYEVEDYVEAIVACLQALVPTVQDWRRVYLGASTDAFMSVLYRIYRLIPAPSLETLFLSCPQPRQYHRICDRLFVNPSHLFGGDVSRLRHLQLDNASLPWSHSDYVGSLRSLRFGGLSPMAWPSIPQMVGTLSLCLHLTYLEFSGGGLAFDLELGPHPSFTMPCLESIVIVHWSDCVPIIDLLACGSFPLLRDMSLSNLDRAAWTAVFKLDALQVISSLTVTGLANNSPDLSHITTLLSRLERVMFLDLRSTFGWYFDHLLMNPDWCPALRYISISEAYLPSLLEYVLLRRESSCANLEQVDFTHSLPIPLAELQYDLMCDIQCLLHRFNVFPDVF